MAEHTSSKKRGALDFNEEEQHFVQKAEQYCVAAEQCATSVRDKMVQWKVEKELADRIILYLQKKDFINEKRFVKFFCESKLHQQKWGRTKIAYHLRLKQISSEVINAGLATIDEEEYRQVLTGLVANKLRELTPTEKPERLDAKVTSSLATRGFEPHEVQSILQTLKQQSDN